jgi:hypothetical protein
MSNDERLYVWITNWESHQYRQNDRATYPWFKVYSDLTSNDDWNDLSTADRCLLVGLWSDTNRLGLGRVSANLTALRSRHSCRRASLDRLVQAGWITLSSAKGAPPKRQSGALEVEGSKEPKRKKENAREAASPNGSASRAQKNDDTHWSERVIENRSVPAGPDGLPLMTWDEWVTLHNGNPP